MTTDHDEILQMIDDCEKREGKLTDWERDFIASIAEQLIDRPLSRKQVDRLGLIWERIT